MRTPAYFRCVPLACLVPGLAMADIVTDGSVGPAQALPGPAYTIGAHLGTQAGSNLFHSFSSFNLASGGAVVHQSGRCDVRGQRHA